MLTVILVLALWSITLHICKSDIVVVTTPSSIQVPTKRGRLSNTEHEQRLDVQLTLASDAISNLQSMFINLPTKSTVTPS